MSNNISLDLYKVFAEVYKGGSFSNAARNLYVTQPAISQSIKQLEAAINVSLFVRDKKRVIPTAEATKLYEMITPALGMIEGAEESIEKMRHLLSGSLSIIAGDTILKRYLLPYLKVFHEKYPDINIVVTNRTSTEAFEKLKSGKIDVAFVNTPIEDDDFEYKTCIKIHDIFVAGEKFSHLKNKTITRAELAQYPLIMLERLSNSRRFVDREFMKDGIALKPEIELGAHELLLDFAKINFGIACVMKEFITPDDELFEVHIDKALPERSTALCWLKNYNMSVAKQKFIEMMNEF